MALLIGTKDQLTAADIKEKTDQYINYITDPAVAAQKLDLSHVFNPDHLRELLNGGYDGIRIQLVKDDNYSGPEKIGAMAIPVKMGNEGFIDQLGVNDKLAFVACPSKYC